MSEHQAISMAHTLRRGKVAQTELVSHWPELACTPIRFQLGWKIRFLCRAIPPQALSSETISVVRICKQWSLISKYGLNSFTDPEMKNIMSGMIRNNCCMSRIRHVLTSSYILNSVTGVAVPNEFVISFRDFSGRLSHSEARPQREGQLPCCLAPL